MLKPRVPGYHGNQIKRRISSESRNPNYSDSFMKGKMKILFTVQRPLHCKGKRKERGEKKKKDEENAIVFFLFFLYLTMQFNPMPLKFIGCLMTTSRLAPSICTQRNDVTTVSLTLQINPLPLKDTTICVSTNPRQNPAHV